MYVNSNNSILLYYGMEELEANNHISVGAKRFYLASNQVLALLASTTRSIASGRDNGLLMVFFIISSLSHPY